MKKDIFVAIASGLILGLIITLGIYTANKALTKRKAQKQSLEQTNPLPSPPLGKVVKKLNITSHESFDLIDQSELTLSGIAWPNAVVALMSEDETQITASDTDGIFSFQFDLIKGFNELTIIATDEMGKTESETLIITYSTTKIELEEDQVSLLTVKQAHAAEATESSITEKLKERLKDSAEVGIENIKDEVIGSSKTPKKKAFIGSIKTINENSLSIEYKSQAFTINLSDNTDLIRSKGSVKLDLEDLEVDNFVLSLGFVKPASDKFTLDTNRVLVIESPESPPSRQLITGKTEEVDGNKIVVDNKRLTITSKTNLDIKSIEDPSSEDIELGDNFYAIVTLDQNGDISLVNNILVIPGKNNPAAMEPTNATESAQVGEATESAETDTTEE